MSQLVVLWNSKIELQNGFEKQIEKVCQRSLKYNLHTGPSHWKVGGNYSLFEDLEQNFEFEFSAEK